MEILFRTRQLQRAFEDHRVAERRWGPVAGRAYVRAVQRLQRLPSWESAHQWQAWRLHRLQGAYSGRWSATLHGRWRLILTYDDGGARVWIEDVSNHYGD